MIDQGHTVGKWHSSNQVTVPLEGPATESRKERRRGEESERGTKTDLPLEDRKKKGTPTLWRYYQMEHQHSPTLNFTGIVAWVWENKMGTHVDDRVLELDMQPVVGDGNESISCAAQELHSLAL